MFLQGVFSASARVLLCRGPGQAGLSTREGTCRPMWPEIHTAAVEGDIDRMRAILAADGSQAHARDATSRSLMQPPSQMTPLHLAASSGTEAMTSLLLQYGASPHATDVRGRRPLHLAALRGNGVVLGVLLQAMGLWHVTALDRLYNTALDYARECSTPCAVVPLLLEYTQRASRRGDCLKLRAIVQCTRGDSTLMRRREMKGAPLPVIQFNIGEERGADASAIDRCKEGEGPCEEADVENDTVPLAQVLRFLSIEVDDGPFRHIVRYL